MAKQRIFFTTLPRGVNPDTGRHRVSVYITPRLEPDADAPSGRSLGPAQRLSRLGGLARHRPEPDRLELGVSADGQDFEPDMTITSPTPVSEAWTELCPPDSLLEDFPGPLPLPFGDRLVVSYPDKTVGDYLVNTLTGLAANPDEPDVDAARNAYEAIDFYDPERDDLDLDEQLAEIIDQLSERGTVRDDPGRPDLGVVQTLLLGEPTLENLQAACEAVAGGASARTLAAQARGGDPPRPTDPPEPPRLDFHQAAGAAGGHPYLMRLLGLVVDFEFTPPPEFLGAQPREALVSLNVSLDSRMAPGDIVTTPNLFTRCFIGANVFEAVPDPSAPATERGLLRLSDRPGGQPKYALQQIDTQGGVLKMLEYVKNLARSQRPGYRNPYTPLVQPPPPLRAAGIAVTQSGRADSVRRSYDRQVSLNKKMMQSGASPPDIFLYREDITRGYAFDVFDSRSGDWYSLCRRIGRARFGAAADDQSPNPLPGDVTWEDEGWVSGAFTRGYRPRDTIRRVTESFASWANGWSMVTPRPGKSVSALEATTDEVQEVGDFKLAVRYAAKPGSLPPQRYGRTYRFRGRAVDIAGNVISSDEATALGGPHVLETPYRRFEPVPPPTVLMRKLVTEGESPDLVVIRSNFETAPAQTTPSDRHIFPASFDQFRAESHGMFDAGGGIRPDVYDQIAGREHGSYDARDSSGNFIHPNAQADPGNYGAPYFDVDTPQFDVEGSTLARMPSLPDPMCGGLAFIGLPGASAGSIQIYDIYRGGATWPDIKPIRLRIFESADFVPPALVGDELRVGMPKGESRNVNLSSSLVASRADHMALHELLPPSLRALIVNGGHWAVTPSRQLRLVHAVRQPLRATEFSGGFVVTRKTGETSILLEDTMATSRKSTERVEVYADWVEKTDYLPADVDEFHEPERWEPEREVPVSSKVFERTIDLQGPDGSLPISQRHELHTTRHIPEISYRTVATTRFKEYFTERAEVTLTPAAPTTFLPSAYIGPAAATAVGVVEDSERVTSLDGTQTFERNQPGEEEGHYTMDYEAGTITRFDVTERPTNMPDQVRVTYIKREITRETEPTVKRALSARRPDPPKLQYAMPTFRRVTDVQSGYTTALRESTGLRIFLDRPWWSSGDGELLGVVLSDQPNSTGVQHLVTRFGQDPIWDSESVSELPQLIDFSAGVASRSNLRLPEAPSDRTFTVVGHEVKPDTEQLRWYCDIDIPHGDAYTPFVRLALARYQPDAVFGLDLSPVVQLDYMQLYPNRFASVVDVGNDFAYVTVSGTTYEAGRFKRNSSGLVLGPSIIEAQVEQRRDDMPFGDELFGWVPVPGVAPVELEYRQGIEGSPDFWAGEIPIFEAGRQRIAIREYEQFGPKVSGKYQRRLVYAEAIDVPSSGGENP